MRSRRLALLVAALPALATACSSSGGASSQPTSTSTSPTVHSSPAKPTATRSTHTTPPGPTPAQIRAQDLKQLHTLIKSQPAGGVSVAAYNVETGRQFSAGANGGMRTASAYKLLMAVAVLLQNGGLDGDEDEAVRALENSDNAAGYSLYLDIGGTPGVQNALSELGMHHSVCCTSDPTLMKTSASDYLKVLKALAMPGKLSPSARNQVLHLMHNVEQDQRWGVGVVADKGTVFANKNGWLSIDNSNGPGDTDDGLWAVTSVGIVTVHGQTLLMSVFSQHQPDYRTGVRLVEHLAKLTAPQVAKL